MISDSKTLFTVDDIQALPDNVRAELIDGKIFYADTPDYKHQILLQELLLAFKFYQKESGKKFKILYAPFAVYINQDNYNYLTPDLIIICPGENDNRLQMDGCYGAPDFILEIVSSSSERMDHINKLNKYAYSGVREYWIVEPMKERVIVHNIENNSFCTQYTFEDTIPVGIYDDLSINFSELNFRF